jgi:protein-S-isoprenylcysteine O-methyltransferase Ste14
VSDAFITRLARLRVPLGFACAAAVLWLARPTSQSLALGGLIAIVGESIRLWAAGHLEKGSEVTRSGPYRFVRHPLYLGSAVVALGGAVASARLAVAIIIAAYVALTIPAAVRHEEANMRAAFGDGYDAYLESRAAPVERPFSFRRALGTNKEHKAVAGVVLFVALLAAKAVFR